MEAVLEAIRNSKLPAEAAALAGIGTATLKEWRRDDPEFGAAYLQAYEDGIDKIEKEAIRRAIEGVLKPVFQGGTEVGQVREYSDTLMGLVLRGRRRDVYNTERHEITGADGGPVEYNVNVTFKAVK